MYRILLVLVALIMSFWPIHAYGVSKVGIIDGERLFDDYKGAQDATEKIADAQEELRKVIADSEKIYSEFEKEKKSDAEKLTKQKELQERIDSKAKKTREMIEALSGNIEKDIVNAIKLVANEKGLEVVFDKRAVLHGGVDITETVLGKLKGKKVPIAKKMKKKK